ncbi:ferrous iron transport protein A [Thermococci archaeon]|nr:MAG: ferrous iron transport protein A [Thermococci archaeon]RLF94656.1 MAG: ferrous iron transport protein A [Thermococci archaeon]
MGRSVEVPLLFLGPGEKGIISRIVGGFCARARLEEMGLTPGKEVELLSPNPIIVSVDGVRIALGYGIASKILVRTRRRI